MKCKKCGCELPPISVFCPGCGGRQEGKRIALLREAFSSSKFLAICILLTITAVTSVKSINIYWVLQAIAAWMIYSSAKDTGAPLKPGGLKLFNIAFKIQYIVAWVAIGCSAVAGLFCAFMLSVFHSVASSWLGSLVEYSADYSSGLSDVLAQIARLLLDPGYGTLFSIIIAFAFFALALMGIAVNVIIIKKFYEYFGSLAALAESGGDCDAVIDHSGMAARMLIYIVINAVLIGFGSIQLNINGNGMHYKFGVNNLLSVSCIAAYVVGFALIKEYEKKR